MKKMMILFVALVAAWCVSCSKDDDGGKNPDDPTEDVDKPGEDPDDPDEPGGEGVIIMTSEGQKIKLRLDFSAISKITIDWGDGTVREYGNKYEEFNNAYRFDVKYEYSQTALHTIKISGCTDLLYLDCKSNQLTSLDVSGCTALTELQCYNNQLHSLDVIGCTALTKLWCSSNQLTSLDISRCTHLTDLYCCENQLSSLNVSGCPDLDWLRCSDNQLPSLDISGCPHLTWLWCSGNQLFSLDVSGCPDLRELFCSYNQFSVSALNQIYTDLPTTDGNITAISNPGYPESDRSIAIGKGWIFREE